MTFVQSGPPEWIWERSPDPLKWEVKELPAHDGPHSVYELKLQCGPKTVRMHVFNSQEMWSLVDTVSHALQRGNNRPRKDGH